MGEGGRTLKAEGHGRGRVLSVGQGLIELEVGDGLWVGGIESGELRLPARSRMLTSVKFSLIQ